MGRRKPCLRRRAAHHERVCSHRGVCCRIREHCRRPCNGCVRHEWRCLHGYWNVHKGNCNEETSDGLRKGLQKSAECSPGSQKGNLDRTQGQVGLPFFLPTRGCTADYTLT